MSVATASGAPQSTALLTVGQAAALLNIHVNTVRRWSAQGLLTTYRIGPRRDRRFERAEVERLLTSHREIPPTTAKKAT